MSHNQPTFLTALLPVSREVRLTEVTLAQEYGLFQLTATAPSTPCPLCGVPSSSVHRRAQRHVTDFPWGLRPVRPQNPPAGHAPAGHRHGSRRRRWPPGSPSIRPSPWSVVIGVPVCKRHSPGGPRGGAGPGPLSSRPQPPPSGGGVPGQSATCAPGRGGLHGDGAHPGR
jgi:hypothetical protein